MERRKIKVMPEYGLDTPLWSDTEDGVSPISCDELPVSDALCERLGRWFGRFLETYEPDDPGSSEFSSLDAEREWQAAGRALASALAQELGPQYEVWYHTFGGTPELV